MNAIYSPSAVNHGRHSRVLDAWLESGLNGAPSAKGVEAAIGSFAGDLEAVCEAIPSLRIVSNYSESRARAREQALTSLMSS